MMPGIGKDFAFAVLGVRDQGGGRLMADKYGICNSCHFLCCTTASGKTMVRRERESANAPQNTLCNTCP